MLISDLRAAADNNATLQRIKLRLSKGYWHRWWA